MFKRVLTICFWAAVLLLTGARGWSEDMEDRFLNPDLDSSKNIFIDVKEASLDNVLKIISQQSNLSFIAAHDVADKKITLYLNKVPLNQALQTVLDANDLTYAMQGDTNVFVVTAKEKTEKDMITRVYQLKYATVSTSQLNSTIAIAGGGKTSAAVGLQQVIKDSLSKEGKVVEDPRTNSLIITDLPTQFDIIESTIAKLDVPVPQVLIEVEMLDVSKSTADQLGITYGPSLLTFTGGSATVGWPFWRNPINSALGGASTTSTTTNGSVSATSLTATLNYLTTNTDARTLARPRILTLNNETAQIEISTDQAISIQQTATSTTTNSSQTSFTPERYTTGVILKVTPQANLLTREVTMAVSPKVIDVILSQVQPSNTAANGQIFDPETRGSDSILKLKDGQSMVIGGLLRNQTSNIISKLPILGDLPIIGAAFRSKNKTTNERELLIFLTPHIIDDTDQSALKSGSSPVSAQAALDMQVANERFQEINNSLNSYEIKQ